MKSPAPRSGPADVTLLQFSTADTLANLLPVLSMKPARILHARAGGEDVAGDQFKLALQAALAEPMFAGWQPKITDLNLPRQADIGDTRDHIARTILNHPGVVLNFSGCGQLPSIGAYLAAQVMGRPSFVCDPNVGRCIDGRTARFEKWPDLREVANAVSMRLIMAINGKKVEDFRSDTAAPALRAYATKAWESQSAQGAALDSWRKALRTAICGTADRPSTNAEDLTLALAKTVPLPGGDALKPFVATMVTAGLITKVEPNSMRLNAAPDRASVERALHLLTNGWLELAVMDCMDRNPRFTDANWGFTGVKSTPNLLEGMPIVCMDRERSQLRCIVAVTQITRSIQEHVDQVRDHAKRVGANSKMLLVYAPNANQESTLRGAARAAGVEVALGAGDIVKAFAPGA